MDRFRVSAALERAADYIDSHGLRSGGFGRPGRPACVNAAIAIGLNLDPVLLGLGPFFRPGTSDESERVAEVVLASGLLEMLPPPGTESWQRRRARPARMSSHRALVEVARWSDSPGRTAEQAVRALRSAAFRMVPAAEVRELTISRTRPATKTA